MGLTELKEAITNEFDEVALLDFLDITIVELVEILEEQINERKEDFRATLDL
jgi:hypothetical protein